jgi:hypothetical protein
MVIQYEHQHTWPHHRARAVDAWIVGWDPAKSHDRSVLAAIHHTVVPVEGRDGWIEGKRSYTQKSTTRYDLRFLHSLPVGLNYVDQALAVREILSRAPLDRATLIVDASGVGAALVDIARASGLRLNSLTITSGREQKQINGNHWHVAKGILVGKLMAAIQSAQLHVAAGLLEADALRSELQNFKVKTSVTGQESWNADVSDTDDRLLAISYALWWATARPVTIVEELRI